MYALTSGAMKYMDDYTMATGISSNVLMENAARGLADEIVHKFPDKQTSMLFMCGAGNNGGDAVAAARWLLHYGYTNIRLFFTGNVASSSKGFAHQAQLLNKAYPEVEFAGLHLGNGRDFLNSKYDLIVDGMYGIGLNRALEDDDTRIVNFLNSKSGFKIAVDIPTGINATSGLIMSAAFKADETVSFGCYKTGMFFGAGREYCGELKLVDIGHVEAGYKNISDKIQILDRNYLEETRFEALNPRKENSHKGTFGTVGIAVCSDGMMGASMLATKAAYRAGCGLVKVFCPSKYTGFFNVSIPEAVVVPYKSDDVIGAFEDFVKGVDAVLIGPGLREDEAGRLLVKQVLSGKTPAVFDAGALNLISKSLKMLRKRKCSCVLTPHLGEMARLCDENINAVARNRIAMTEEFSREFNVSMVVKSDVSLVSLCNGDNEQSLFLNTLGNSGLATAGSGDVLAGVIASLIAQGNTLNNSLLYGVMLHGAAAEKFAVDDDSKRKMMAGDIIDKLF